MSTINIDGLRVEYEDEGTGLPVVFVPDLTGSSDWFRYQLSGLSEHHRIISYNLRASSRGQEYTLDLLTEDLARFLNALRIISAVIVGHGFGGLIAQKFAASYRQSTTALILSSTFPHLPPMTNHQVHELLAPGPVEFESPLGGFFRRLFGGRRSSPEEADGLMWLAAHNAGLNRQTLDARTDIVGNFDSRALLPEITFPTLLIVGAQDREPILTGTQALYEGIPDTTLEVIEGSDHFAFFTRHDLYNDVVDDFLVSHLAELS